MAFAGRKPKNENLISSRLPKNIDTTSVVSIGYRKFSQFSLDASDPGYFMGGFLCGVSTFRSAADVELRFLPVYAGECSMKFAI